MVRAYGTLVCVRLIFNGLKPVVKILIEPMALEVGHEVSKEEARPRPI
jgi:hypothetical protein